MHETFGEADLQRKVLGGVIAVAISPASALDKTYIAVDEGNYVPATEKRERPCGELRDICWRWCGWRINIKGGRR